MDEAFHIVDKNDRIIGQAARSEVHGNPELIHRVSHVLVFNSQGALFLQKRALSKDVQPGRWDTSVGGHVDKNESYATAAMREMKEELGFTPGSIQFLYKYLHSNDYESEYVSTFRCTWDGPIYINRDEIMDGRFWTLNEIRSHRDRSAFTPNFLDELDRFQAYIA